METVRLVWKSCSTDLVTARTVTSSYRSSKAPIRTTQALSTTPVSRKNTWAAPSLMNNLTWCAIRASVFVEFLAATMDATTFLRETYLKTAFKMFDTDNSGKIDSTELLQLLAGEEFRDVYSQQQLDQAIAEVDENGDGEIDF